MPEAALEYLTVQRNKFRTGRSTYQSFLLLTAESYNSPSRSQRAPSQGGRLQRGHPQGPCLLPLQCGRFQGTQVPEAPRTPLGPCLDVAVGEIP